MTRRRGRLIDPSRYVIVRVTHEAGGKTLHESADCPRNKDCPVWTDLHRIGRGRRGNQ